MVIRLLALLTLLVAVGCSRPVIVVDGSGKPVQDANVEPVSLSMNGSPTKTDAAGIAEISSSVGPQETKWVSVEKVGFDPVQVAVPAKWPLRVTLAPAGTTKLVPLLTRP